MLNKASKRAWEPPRSVRKPPEASTDVAAQQTHPRAHTQCMWCMHAMTGARACSDDDVRLVRRIQRDVKERGRSVEDVLSQYSRFVKPAHDDFIAPSKRVADIVIPWHRGDNLVAVDLIVGHLQSHIVADPLQAANPNLHLLESTFQMRGMHTIIRDRTTSKGDFIFFSDRIIRLVRARAAGLTPGGPAADITREWLQVVEYALGLLPAQEATVVTPTKSRYHGLKVRARVCGVSIVRSGEAMEAALRSCWKGIDIGKILVYRRHWPSPRATPPDTPATSPSPSALPIARDTNGNYYQTHAGAVSVCAPHSCTASRIPCMHMPAQDSAPRSLAPPNPALQ
jgi:Phosphoribulokinase / Uridine kinase family/Uracil phosphoribosyltransferase